MSSSSSSTSSLLPRVVYQPTRFNRTVLDACPTAHRPFEPTPWLANAHAQTLLGGIFRPYEPIAFARERLVLRDGGQLMLDWDHPAPVERGEERADVAADANTHADSAPIVVLFPGLNGCSNARYVRNAITAYRRHMRSRAVVFNYRGFHCTFTTPMATTGCDVSDVEEALRHVHARYPRAPVFVVGYSMGANMLVKCLGMLGEHARRELGIVAAMSVSNAFDFVELSKSLERNAWNRLVYSRWLTFRMKRSIFAECAPERTSERMPVESESHETLESSSDGRPSCSRDASGSNDQAARPVVSRSSSSRRIVPSPRAAHLSSVASSAASSAASSSSLASSSSTASSNSRWALFRSAAAAVSADSPNARLFRQHRHLGIDIEHVLRARTIRELDDRLTRRLYGIDSVDAYYAAQSSAPWLPFVDVPLMCLNALDDPFAGVLPVEQAERHNANVIFVTTQRGGHVAWATEGHPFRSRDDDDDDDDVGETVAAGDTPGISPQTSQTAWMNRLMVQFFRGVQLAQASDDFGSHRESTTTH